MEVSTQLPDASYCATARVESGVAPALVPDDTRRCVRTGALHTDGSGSIHGFAGSTGRIVAGTLNNTVQAYPAMADADSPAWPPTVSGLWVRSSASADRRGGVLSGRPRMTSTRSGNPWGGISVLTFDTSRHVSDNGPVSLGAARQVLYGISQRPGTPGSGINVHRRSED